MKSVLIFAEKFQICHVHKIKTKWLRLFLSWKLNFHIVSNQNMFSAFYYFNLITFFGPILSSLNLN